MKCHRIFKLFCGLISIVAVTSVTAQQRYVCRGRALPSDKDRKVSDHRLECSSSASRFTRDAQKLSRADLDAWRALKRNPDLEKRKQMQKIWQKLPLIKWSGRLDYETSEKWTWQEYVYSQHPSCGYEKVKVGTRKVVDSYDKDGNETSSHLEDVYEERMKTCWHDEARYETRFCSDEYMDFKSQYIRPAVSEWGPGTKWDDRNLDPLQQYYDVLPNKYDLLPAEAESVTIYNGANGESLLPSESEVSFGDAWNKYSPQVKITKWTRGNPGQCNHDNPVAFEVAIHTDHRVKKTSPNAFRLPIDKWGRPESPFDWEGGRDDEKYHDDRRPRALKLMEASAVLIESMAEMSRTSAKEVGAIPADDYANSQKSGVSSVSGGISFFHDPEVKSTLFLDNFLGRDTRLTPALVARGADTADRDARVLEDRYFIDLMTRNFYRASGELFGINFDWLGRNLPVGLRKGSRYYFEIQMRNPGVPFYDSKKFSKPLVLWVPEQDGQGQKKTITIDSRPFYQKVLYWQSRSVFTKIAGF